MCPNKQNNMFWQVCHLNFFQKMYIPKLYRGRGSVALSLSLLLFHVFPKGNRNLSFGTTLYSIEQFCRYKSLSYLFMRTYLQEYIKSKWSCLSRILICTSKLNSQYQFLSLSILWILISIYRILLRWGGLKMHNFRQLISYKSYQYRL